MCCGHTLFHVPQSSVLKNSPFLIVTDWRAGPSCASLASPRRCRTCQAPACRGHNQELGAFQERMDRDESAAMSTENAERMQQTDDAWNGRDWDAFDLLHDPECVVYWPGRTCSGTTGRSSGKSASPDQLSVALVGAAHRKEILGTGIVVAPLDGSRRCTRLGSRSSPGSEQLQLSAYP
jgi:hypothetical protein